MKKIITVILLLTVIASLAYSQDNSFGFRDFRVKKIALDGQTFLGYRHFTKDVSSVIVPSKAVLPESYDSRNFGYITPVRNQNPWGTCWAFSTLATMEAFSLKNYAEAYSFSPLNMARNTGYPYVDQDLDWGGNFYIATAYLQRLIGPVAEDDDPYVEPYESVTPQPDAIGYCANAYQLHDNDKGLTEAELDVIKENVYNNGAVQISFGYYDEYISDDTFSYYCPESFGSNHAVTVVGWDDNYSKDNFAVAPETDGALLIKNSWGPSWHDKGFFWLSYADATIGAFNSYDFVKPEDISYNGQLTYNAGTATLYFSGYKYAKVTFNPETDGRVEGIRIYTYTNGRTVEATITNLRTKQTQTVYSTPKYPGYQTETLNNFIEYSKGDQIEVVFDYNYYNSGISYIPVEGSDYGLTPIVEPGTQAISNNVESWTYVNYNIMSSLLIAYKVSGIEISEDKVDIHVGDTYQLEATVLPENAKNKKVIWSSSNESCATVDQTGLVTAVGKGRTYITATTEEGEYSATCEVGVGVLVESVSLDYDVLEVQLNKEFKLTATVLPENADNKDVTWESSDTEVATVDENGVVKGLKTGKAEITVTTEDGGYQDKCSVTVVDPEVVSDIKLNPDNVEMDKGETTTIIATVIPETAVDKKVFWTSNDTSVITVDDEGNVTALAAGFAKVIATTRDGGKTASAFIKVKDNKKVTGVELDKSVLDIFVGDDPVQLNATVLPETAVNKKVTWTSSNSKIAKVDNDGKVTGVGAGQATITVKTNEGSFTAKCVVNVGIHVFDIQVNPNELLIVKGMQSKINYTVLPENATNKKVIFESTDETIATVNGSGVVTGVEDGTCDIHVISEDNKGIEAIVKIIVNDPDKVKGVTVSPSELTLFIGEKYKLNESVFPANAKDKRVHWSVKRESPFKDSTVAKVEQDGTVTALEKGNATIIVKTVDGGYKAECVLTVKDPLSVTSVRLNKNKIDLAVDGSEQLEAIIKPTNARNKNVSWYTSDPSVATVDGNGKVYGVSEGVAVITVVTEDGNYTDTCTVNVKYIPSESIVLNKSNIVITKDEGFQLIATVKPYNVSNKNVVWSSSDYLVANVNDYGFVLGNKKGIATIIAKTGDGKHIAKCKVVVK